MANSPGPVGAAGECPHIETPLFPWDSPTLVTDTDFRKEMGCLYPRKKPFLSPA